MSGKQLIPASALWTRNKNEISEEQYIEFYKNLSHDFDAPLAWAHNRVEGSTEYTQLLYVLAKHRTTFLPSVKPKRGLNCM